MFLEYVLLLRKKNDIIYVRKLRFKCFIQSFDGISFLNYKMYAVFIQHITSETRKNYYFILKIEKEKICWNANKKMADFSNKFPDLDSNLDPEITVDKRFKSKFSLEINIIRSRRTQNFQGSQVGSIWRRSGEDFFMFNIGFSTIR